MRVAVVLNGRAGGAEISLSEEKIRTALFRCELSVAAPKSGQELRQFLKEQIETKADYLLICGGDGTINFCLQQIAALGFSFDQIPPMAIVSGGTANDLASEMKISKRIEKAARLILTGNVRKIDVIEVVGDGQRGFMVTNGGVGLPAVAADHANQVRRWLRERTDCNYLPEKMKSLAGVGAQVVRKLGQKIYLATSASAIGTWQSNQWEIEVESPAQEFRTTAPIIIINNQPTLRGGFPTAPMTSNGDGAFNVLIADAASTLDQLRAMLQLKKGILGFEKGKRSFESSSLRLTALHPERSLTFFGDGEILVRDARVIELKCLHRALRLVVE